GQCNVRVWTDDLLPLVEDPADPLGVGDLVTHRLPLDEAPAGYDLFQRKHDGCIKVVLDPTAPVPHSVHYTVFASTSRTAHLSVAREDGPMPDQLTFTAPDTRFPVITPPKQDQPESGPDAELIPGTDRGEDSYRGTGRLEGRRA